MVESGQTSKLSRLMDRFSPDILRTFRRFPLAIFLIGITACVFTALIHDFLNDDADFWARIGLGAATGAAMATAGRLFVESRPGLVRRGFVLAYILPLIFAGLVQIEDTQFIFVWVLPVVAGFWLSVSAFTKLESGAAREAAQNRFWWLNHRAITAAAVALLGYILIGLGMLAIERSLAMLFGLDISEFFYELVLPMMGLFFIPVYWLSTLPALDEYRETELTEPDFLSRAIGFLGQFVLAPLLSVYALILLAFAVQILVNWRLPEGTLGWMVLAFTTTGAATWLVLHPAFMRGRGMVRFFRRYWFWATILPIGLYALAAWVRIDAYGLTPDRVLLVAGCLWASILTLAFLRPGWGDIRLIPALAGLMFLGLSIGPWNLENASNWSQANRLEAALIAAGAPGDNLDWETDIAVRARGALKYLSRKPERRHHISAVFERLGIEVEVGTNSMRKLANGLDLPVLGIGSGRVEMALGLSPDMAGIDLSATPYYLGDVKLYKSNLNAFGLQLRLEDNILFFSKKSHDAVPSELSLAEWIDAQNGSDYIADATISFSLDGRLYRIVADYIYFSVVTGTGGQSRELRNLTGTLYSDAP